jgi:hypothetical protein
MLKTWLINIFSPYFWDLILSRIGNRQRSCLYTVHFIVRPSWYLIRNHGGNNYWVTFTRRLAPSYICVTSRVPKLALGSLNNPLKRWCQSHKSFWTPGPPVRKELMTFVHSPTGPGLISRLFGDASGAPFAFFSCTCVGSDFRKDSSLTF